MPGKVFFVIRHPLIKRVGMYQAWTGGLEGRFYRKQRSGLFIVIYYRRLFGRPDVPDHQHENYYDREPEKP